MAWYSTKYYLKRFIIIITVLLQAVKENIQSACSIEEYCLSGLDEVPTVK